LGLIELAMLPSTIFGIEAKGNGKAIASVIRTQSPHVPSAIVVQNPVRLGFPDPIYNYVLNLYLNEAPASPVQIPIFELPGLENITREQGLRQYFGGGGALVRRYASVRADAWREWLRTCPYDRLWIVSPESEIAMEKRQTKAFEGVLESAGFRIDPRNDRELEAYPRTRLRLAIRPKKR
jgi:hypothetical protein